MSAGALGPRIAAIYEAQAAFMEPRLAEIGVSWATFQLLTCIYAAGSSSQAEIARRLGVTPATLSEAVTAQAKSGVVAQVSSSSDRRVKELRLTDKGTELMKQVIGIVEQSETVMVQGLKDAERVAAAKLLDRLLANAEAALDG